MTRSESSSFSSNSSSHSSLLKIYRPITKWCQQWLLTKLPDQSEALFPVGLCLVWVTRSRQSTCRVLTRAISQLVATSNPWPTTTSIAACKVAFPLKPTQCHTRKATTHTQSTRAPQTTTRLVGKPFKRQTSINMRRVMSMLCQMKMVCHWPICSLISRCRGRQELRLSERRFSTFIRKSTQNLLKNKKL